MSFKRSFLSLIASSLLMSCGFTPTSSTKDVGAVDGVKAVLLHFNKAENTYDVWHCPEYKVVQSFAECEAGGEKVHTYEGGKFFKTIVKLLKTYEKEITTPNHRAWINTAAQAVLNDEMPEIEKEQARLRKEIDEVATFIDFFQDRVSTEVLEEKKRRQQELKKVNDRFAELNIYYKKTVELTSNFIALVESEESIFYKEIFETPTYGLIFSKLTAGFVGPAPAGMRFVQIPAGSFMMGSPESEEGHDDDEVQHRVTISKAFEMQVTEVTRGQWHQVMGSYPDNNPLVRKDGICHPTVKEDNHPVTCVSWNDTQDFIAKLNQKDSFYHYRLPTEAEWEYAARAGTTGKYSVDGPVESFAWYDGNSGGQTHPVAQLKPNDFGLYDVHGNVWEWTADWYKENYYSNSPSTDPTGPSSGSYRVIRGGSWYSIAQYVRSANRSNGGPANRYYDVGLRLLRTLR